MKKICVFLTLSFFVIIAAIAQKTDTIITYKLSTVETRVGNDVLVPVIISSNIGDSIYIGAIGMKFNFNVNTLTYMKTININSAFLPAGGTLSANSPKNDSLVAVSFSSAGFVAAKFGQNDTLCTLVFNCKDVVSPTFISHLIYQIKNTVCFKLNNAVYPLILVNGKVMVAPPKPPSIQTQPQNSTVCDGNEAQIAISAKDVTTYQWQVSTDGTTFNDLNEFIPYSNVNTSTLIINPANTDLNNFSYRCLLTNIDGTITSENASLTVNSFPQSTITASGSTLICDGSFVQLNATTGNNFSYKWMRDNNLLNETTASVQASLSGSYIVVVTANNCSATSSAITVSVKPTPTITSTNSGFFCKASEITLTATASAGIINWYNNEGVLLNTGITYTVSGMVSSTLYVDATLDGCTTHSRTKINADPVSLPLATINTAGTTTFCTGGSVILTANTGSGLSYSWLKDNNVIPDASNSSYTANLTGSYTVVVTNTNNCSNTSQSVVVNVTDYSSISGLVKFNGSNVTKGIVELYTLSTSTTLFASFTLDVTGAYSFTNVPLGKYIVYATADISTYPDAEGTYFGDQLVWSDATVIDINECGMSFADKNINVISSDQFPLGNGVVGGIITLTSVKSKSVTPAADVKVIIEYLGTKAKKTKQTKTDKDGKYEFSLLPVGKYIIVLDIPGYPQDSIPQLDITSNDSIINGVDFNINKDMINLIYKHMLTGVITYFNGKNTLLSNVTVNLKTPEGTLVDSYTTAADGAYVFNNVANGTYKIEATTTIAWGGSDPLDALFVNRNYIGSYSFADKLFETVADVNKDGFIDPLDALFINRRYIGAIPDFTLSDWTFEPVNIVVNYSDATKNIKAVCAGDVNGDFDPYAKKLRKK